MASYIIKQKLDAPGNDISCTSADAKLSCDNDLTCVGYNYNLNTNKPFCHKNNISRYADSPASNFYAKDVNTECPKKNILNENYLSNFCLNSTLNSIENIKSNILLSEQNKPLMMIIGHDTSNTTSINSNTFIKPIYVHYKLSSFVRSNLININNNKTQALKIFFYVNILVNNNYKFKTDNTTSVTKLFIDTIPITLNTTVENNIQYLTSDQIYLTTGDHLFYIELLIPNDVDTKIKFDPWVYPATAVPGDSHKLKNIIKTPYTVYTNIKNIKNTTDAVYCSPSNFTSDAYCQDLIKNGTTINSDVVSSCLNSNGEYVNNSSCDTIVFNAIKQDTSINSTLIKQISDPVLAWYINRLKNIGSSTSSDEIKKLEQYYPYLKQYNKSIPISDNLNGLVSYCEAKVGDNYSYPEESSICGIYYNDSTLTNNTQLNNSKNKIMTDYCANIPLGSTQPRYETNEQCKTLISNSNLLDNTIKSKCMPNNTWSIDNEYCNNLVDSNINNKLPTINKTLLSAIIDSKTKFAVSDISNISNENSTLKSEKFITDIYNNYESKDENAMINDNFINYCLTKDSNLKNSSCGPIYKSYPSNNKIINSKIQMRSANCISQDNMLTDLDTENAINSNTNKCKSLVFDSSDPNNIALYSKTATEYCGKDSNIVNDTCKTYYNGIESNLVKNQFNNFETNKLSSFNNKENIDNKYDDNKYQYIFIILIIIFVLIAGSMSIKKNNKKKNIINQINVKPMMF